ncbi:ATP-binding protein, partial [Patescibacteria group bacterium]|nr:ATP-binding protein [Patescibacteria group bacterium]
MTSFDKTEPLLLKIDKAIKQSTESDGVEFKDARGGLPSDVWKAISAFSNSPGGGIIVFGVVENEEKRTFEAVGNLDIATLQEKIVSLFQEKIKNAGIYNL